MSIGGKGVSGTVRIPVIPGSLPSLTVVIVFKEKPRSALIQIRIHALNADFRPVGDSTVYGTDHSLLPIKPGDTMNFDISDWVCAREGHHQVIVGLESNGKFDAHLSLRFRIRRKNSGDSSAQATPGP